jgi:HPt (histidine-containing phosphotransfer) domain-containing protein
VCDIVNPITPKIETHNDKEESNMSDNSQNTPDSVSLKDSLTGIDFDVGVNNVLGDEELFSEILVMFYQDHHLDGDKLNSALQSQDIDSMKHLAHTLKGVSCSVGAMLLFEKTKNFDFAINESRVNEYESLLSELLPELTTVMQSIKTNLNVSNN